MSSMTFDELEQNADRAFAYALLARLPDMYARAVYNSWRMASFVDKVVTVLTPEKVERLTHDPSETAQRVRFRLQGLYDLLAQLSRSEEARTVIQLPFLGPHIGKIQERTEDLGDILDTMALATNASFKDLVKCFSSDLGIEQPEDVVGRMHS
jgi:hypothetical protein